MNWLDRLIKLLPYIAGAILLVFVINKMNSCGKINIPSVIGGQAATVVIPLTPTAPTSDDYVHVPTGATITAVVKPTVPIATGIGQTASVSIIVYTDPKCNTCTGYQQVVVVKEKIGFVLEPKAYFGYTDTRTVIGLGLGLFRYGKTSLNALLTVPYVGLGAGYNITNNFYILAGVNSRYLDYNSIGDISSWKLNTADITKIQPLIGVGFHF